MKTNPILLNKGYRKGIKFLSHLTPSIRILPSFIIFGVPKCGTTSLYNYLVSHPLIISATSKEVRFFDNNFEKGIDWYRGNFPSHFLEKYYKSVKKKNPITGEASASYFFHPLAPTRVKKLLPKVKLISLLRNPVERAYSHYFQSVRASRENNPFDTIIEQQIAERRLFEKEDSIHEDNNFKEIYHPNAYISYSIYIDGLKKWYEIFPKEQILIIKSEDMYENPSETLKKTFQFLEMPELNLKKYKKYNYHGYDKKINPDTRKKLAEFFQPYNEELYNFLDRNFNWS